jgi:predicted aspartyl protease
MKGIRFILMVSIAVVLISGCSIGSGGAKVSRFEGFKADSSAAPAAYAGVWEAARRFDFTSAEKSGWIKAYPLFAQGLECVMDGRYHDAEKAFSRVLESPKDSIEAGYAKSALSEALVFQSKWKKAAQIEDDTAALARAFAAADPETLNFPERPVELPAKIGMAGTPEIEVEVNGVRRRFIIDTGAGLSVLSSDVAEACGVASAGGETAEAGTSTNAKVSIRPAVISRLSLGGLSVANHPCIIIDRKDLEIKLFGFIKILKIDGIIGWNLIQRMDMTLDYKNRRVIVQKPVPSENREKNFFWLGYPVARVDTGANRTSVSDAALFKIDTAGMKTKKVRVGGAGGKIETSLAKLIPAMPVVAGGRVLTFEGVRCGKADYGSFFILDGILGSDAAKEGAMRLDFTNGRFDLIFPEKE